MRIAGIILTVIGIILFIFTFLPWGGDMVDRGSRLVWSFTWSSMLAMFIFFAGAGLLFADYNRKKQEKNQNRVS